MTDIAQRLYSAPPFQYSPFSPHLGPKKVDPYRRRSILTSYS